MPRPDSYYIDFIKNTKFLKDITKKIYLKKLATIQKDICPGASMETIINNPALFKKNMEAYANKTKGRIADSLGNHARDILVTVIISLFLYNQQLKEDKYELYMEWKKIHDEIREPINNKYNSNEPTPKQKESYVSFDDVLKMRDSLKPGSMERLLLMMYTEIPPVRSDYYHTRIYREIPPTFGTSTENHIVLNKKSPFLVLEKYKTAKTYGLIVIDLPQKLVNEIEISLVEYPRNYLFTSPLGNPFDKENTFNKWANRILKRLFNKKNITLSMLRHIYISRRDLKLEEKSGLEQQQIAKLMGHSIEQQRKYLWHSWLKNIDAAKTI
jgi:integrase